MRRNTVTAKLPRAAFSWREISGLAGLVGLTICFLAVSWRRWPDPLIDIGRELYTPWRLANGALLYRDVDDFYGPLSKYFNATLFALFEPGLMVLVAANLVVFGAILAALYLLLRKAWGVGAALFASAIFISLFGFSQFVAAGNYNYATPYSHEATHGLLLCLLLSLVLVQWVQETTVPRSFMAGLLLGLTALLKPEILFAAGAITGVAALERWRRHGRPNLSVAIAWAVAAVLPTAGFTAYFSCFLPFTEALFDACHGWVSIVASTRFTGDQIEMAFLGLDRPWEHLVQHAFATFGACVLIATIAGAAWLGEKFQRRWLALFSGTLLVAGMVFVASTAVNWREIGRCLFGLVLLYLLVDTVIAILRRKPVAETGPVKIAQRLIAVLALVMMARMILNGRIYHYGFYQAALAASVIPAVLTRELSQRLGLRRRGQTTLMIGVMALLVPGVVILARHSVRTLEIKTLAIGEGRDRFYAFPPQFEPTGENVRIITETLRQDQGVRSLLVLPEGIVINYLTRLPSTVAPFFFFSSATEGGREEEIVRQLERRPPDAVVIISRNLSEYGIERYGERPGRGELILRWVVENYRVDHQDPQAFVILKRK